MFDEQLIGLMAAGLWETLYMTALSTAFSYLIGLPLGLLLAVTAPDGIRPRPALNAVLGGAVNVLRSVPFVILMVTVIPLTRLIMGTAIGSTATIVPLVVAAAPFVARVVEGSVREVDRGVVEAAQSIGASPMQIVRKVLLPEALPSLISGAATATISILGYSAMAGIAGGGGLGAIAINYGYYRGNTGIMYVMVVLLVLIVQGLQELGARLSAKSDRRAKNLPSKRKRILAARPAAAHEGAPETAGK